MENPKIFRLRRRLPPQEAKFAPQERPIFGSRENPGFGADLPKTRVVPKYISPDRSIVAARRFNEEGSNHTVLRRRRRSEREGKEDPDACVGSVRVIVGSCRSPKINISVTSSSWGGPMAGLAMSPPPTHRA